MIIMGDVLRRVLQRKKAFLNRFLSDVTEEQLMLLRELDLLSDDSSLHFMKPGKMKKLMDNINLSEDNLAEEFLSFLQQEYIWIYDEIQCEVKAELLDLALDDYEVEEAAALIHRHFGRSRRFAERDKKTMTALVATRSQVAKEIWKYRLAAITDVLDEVKARLQDMEKAIRATDDVIRDFLRHHQVELHDFSHGLKSTSQTLLETGGSKTNHEDVFDSFLRRVSFLVDRFRKALFENQSLLNQKKECMKILDCQFIKHPLDSVLSKKIRTFSEEHKNNANHIKNLEVRNHGLEKDIRMRDGQIVLLRTELQRLKKEVERQPEVVLPPIDLESNRMVAPRSPNINEGKNAPGKVVPNINKSPKVGKGLTRRCALNKT